MAGVDIFPSAEGGVAAMAEDFGVQFLGSIPLDSRVTAACDVGVPCTAAFRGLVEKLLLATDMASPTQSGVCKE